MKAIQADSAAVNKHAQTKCKFWETFQIVFINEISIVTLSIP